MDSYEILFVALIKYHICFYLHILFLFSEMSKIVSTQIVFHKKRNKKNHYFQLQDHQAKIKFVLKCGHINYK